MSTDPPPHVVDPDDVDDELHPTAAWTLGEHLDADVAAKLRELTKEA